jgi:hypothetical protein
VSLTAENGHSLQNRTSGSIARFTLDSVANLVNTYSGVKESSQAESRPMPKRSRKRDRIALRHGRTSADLGRLTAEHDADLAKYYVERDRYVARALNIADQASFFVGLKGAGKSAILQMVRLERQGDHQRLISLSPTQLAFSAFANINIASPLLKDPNKKQWLYKSLWDYIIATEIGGREYIGDSNFFVGAFKNLLRGSDEKLVRKLLRLKYDDNGHPESLSTQFLKLIKEIELSGSFDIDGMKLEVKGKADPGILARGKQSQFKFLGMIHEVSSRLADTICNPYYLLIDDLDVDWHNEATQNDIIAAMFASLRKICRPPHLKCIVAIQDRIFRELPIEHKDKFRDALCMVEWDAEAVRLMIEKRIKYVVDVPAGKIWGGLFPSNGFDFIWSRIGGKPREAIRLASICIETARTNGHKSVEYGDMKTALIRFSTERLEDISSELEFVYPSFISFLRTFSGYHKEFPLSKVRDAVEACIIKSLDEPKGNYKWIGGYEHNYHELARVLLENNILLFKQGRTDQPQPFNHSAHDIYSQNAFVAFHPMYAPGLGLIGDL